MLALKSTERKRVREEEEEEEESDRWRQSRCVEEREKERVRGRTCCEKKDAESRKGERNQAWCLRSDTGKGSGCLKEKDIRGRTSDRG